MASKESKQKVFQRASLLSLTYQNMNGVSVTKTPLRRDPFFHLLLFLFPSVVPLINAAWWQINA